jgi:hypothetical protein
LREGRVAEWPHGQNFVICPLRLTAPLITVTGNTSANKANVNEHCSLTTAGAISSIAAAAQSELKPTLDRREPTLYVKENKWWDPTTPSSTTS